MTQTDERNGTRRPLALALYLLGLLLMVAVAAITIWPEMEASLFDRPLVTETTLRTLRCPLAVTPEEEATIQATFTNNQEREQAFRAQARLSFQSAMVIEELDQWVELAPGETEVVRWPLDPGNAAYGRLILARIHVSRRGAISPQQRACGLMVLDLPLFTGTQYVLGMALAGLLAVAAAAYLWLAGARPVDGWQEPRARRLALLVLPVAGAMAAGLFNVWAVGGLLLLFTLILLLSFIQQ